MLRVNTITSAAGAKHYYTQALSREDYYIDGQDITGHWHGVGARLLVLPREVSKEAFFALCDNIHPRTGDTLTVRQKANRRVGYDFTFSAPKSLAILYALKKDDRILTAFRAAVQDTMREMETAIQTQVGKGGKQPPRTTGNLVWADFIHTVTRPVEGMPDPDLHAHCVAFNTTWDRKERRWKAGEFHDLKQNAPYYEAVFHSRLAARIRALGFGVERNGKWWDIAGVPRDLIDTFSRRSAIIKAKEQALGITDPDARGELGARTREKKIPGLDRTTLEKNWISRPSPAQWQALEHLYSGGSSAASGGRPVTPDQAMEYAITHCFSRASVVPEKHLLETALRRGVGYVSPEEIERAAIRAGVLTRMVDGRPLATTKAVLAEEQAMFAFARNGRGTCRMLGGVDAYRYHATTLNAGQVAAVKHVLTSHDRVMLIRGLAGTGKTTLMQQAVAAIEAQSGKQVFTFAPSSDASRGTLREAGFAEAQTVAHLFAGSVQNTCKKFTHSS
jgi:conjugative relaxase-like TrwC/TraI family protein